MIFWWFYSHLEGQFLIWTYVLWGCYRGQKFIQWHFQRHNSCIALLLCQARLKEIEWKVYYF